MISTLRLTENNLVSLNLKDRSPPVLLEETQIKPEKMSEKRRARLIDEYNDYWRGFSNDEDAEIYDKMVRIAKKKYANDAELAKFEEEFYQHFIMNDEYNHSMKKIYRYYDEDAHQNLIELRERADNGWDAESDEEEDDDSEESDDEEDEEDTGSNDN